MTSELENNVVAVERIKEYVDVTREVCVTVSTSESGIYIEHYWPLFLVCIMYRGSMLRTEFTVANVQLLTACHRMANL